MKISTILDQIDLGAMALPEFQRGYVWNREQVRGLMHSLYHRHPVGSLLVWVTKTENVQARGNAQLQPGSVKLILDGQQRMTSLYGLVRGHAPKFFDGNEQAFTGLYFNLVDESFRFYMPTIMKNNSVWIDVTRLLKDGAGQMMQNLVRDPQMQEGLETFLSRVNAVNGIKDIELHIEEVTGQDKTVDVVVDIFNRVNSGGTKLSKGDLALAKICAEWPQAREEMKNRLSKWKSSGFTFRLEWLLRNINAILTGEALFTALRDIDQPTFEDGLKQAETCVDQLLNMTASRLGLDNDRVLGSRSSFPLMARYLTQRGGKIQEAKERDKLLYWYIHTFLWGRYSGQHESSLNRDLAAIENVTANDAADGLDRLIGELRQERGDLKLNEVDFLGSTKGARFYPLLYMMTRACHSKDWGTGDELTNHLLGQMSSLQVHHIFPKARLYEAGYSQREANAIANFTFLTQETNLEVTNREPSEYIPAYEEKNPGSLTSHWIPMDPELWKIENYPTFLAERRELLKEAANGFLEKLLVGAVAEYQDVSSVIPHQVTIGGIQDSEEESQLLRCAEWVEENGLPEGELLYELIDEVTGDILAILDLAWPGGLQEGFSQPVALLLGEGGEVEDAANRGGYRFFTSVELFKEYVEREVLVLELG